MAYSAPRTWATGETVTAAHMNQELRDNLNAGFPDAVTSTDWDPTLTASTTNPDVTSTNGAEYRIAALQFGWARWVFDTPASTRAGSGTYSVTIPWSAVGLDTGSSGQAVGSWWINDSGGAAGNIEVGTVLLFGANSVRFTLQGNSALNSGVVSSFTGTPVLSCQFVIPVA